MSVKRKTILLEEKVEVVKFLSAGNKQSEACKRFHLASSTVNRIWKEKNAITEQYKESPNKKIKRRKKTQHEDLDEAVLCWFKQQRSSCKPISGPILKEKALQLASKLGIENFSGSTGWLDKFKIRHGITFGKITGEAGAVDKTMVENWLRDKWPEIRTGFEDKDIFNGDETDLFFKMSPKETLKFKNEDCAGGKMSKQRLTVFVCANMNGTEKREILVIGKSKKPRCFKNVAKLPVRYAYNNKSWMTGAIFEKELMQWDHELEKQKRRILLLVDNCPAHPKIQNLQNITLAFLPPNSTSVLQPMDQGVIRSLKAFYR